MSVNLKGNCPHCGSPKHGTLTTAWQDAYQCWTVYPHDGPHRRGEICLRLCKGQEAESSLESSRAEVGKAKRSLLGAGFTDNGSDLWAPPLGPSAAPLLDEVDRLRAEVQRLTEEARRSDAGRVVVPELTDNDIEMIYNSCDAAHSLAGIARRSYALAVSRSRLSPSPQPATGAVVIVPDLSENDEAEIRHAALQECDDTDSDRMVIAYNLAVSRIPGARTPSMIEAEAAIREANAEMGIEEDEPSPQPSADVVVVPREEWEATSRDSKQLKDCVQEFERLKDATTMKDEKIPLPSRVRDALYIDIDGVLAAMTTNHAKELRSSTNHDAQDAGAVVDLARYTIAQRSTNHDAQDAGEGR